MQETYIFHTHGHIQNIQNKVNYKVKSSQETKYCANTDAYAGNHWPPVQLTTGYLSQKGQIYYR